MSQSALKKYVVIGGWRRVPGNGAEYLDPWEVADQHAVGADDCVWAADDAEAAALMRSNPGAVLLRPLMYPVDAKQAGCKRC